MSQMAVTSLNPTGESGKRLNVRNRTRAWVRSSRSPGLERALKPAFSVQTLGRGAVVWKQLKNSLTHGIWINSAYRSLAI